MAYLAPFPEAGASGSVSMRYPRLNIPLTCFLPYHGLSPVVWIASARDSNPDESMVVNW
jgi:hypothetical protein